jgi:hypothetical protein
MDKKTKENLKKYSDKTKKQARIIICEYFETLIYSLMQLDEIEPKDYEEILSTIKDRDLLLLEKLGLSTK